jgi:hypothetical protein
MNIPIHNGKLRNMWRPRVDHIESARGAGIDARETKLASVEVNRDIFRIDGIHVTLLYTFLAPVAQGIGNG